MKRPHYGIPRGHSAGYKEMGIKIVRCPRCKVYAWLRVWWQDHAWWCSCPSCGRVRLT